MGGIRMNYKKGDRIVAVRDGVTTPIKKGDEFICDGLTACPNCGVLCTYLVRYNKICNSSCTKGFGCGYLDPDTRENYFASGFIKKPSHGELTEYRLSVSAPELTEIKTPQLS
jgi:hypothetical protein